MNPSTPVFLMGLGVGTGLLILGLVLGNWMAKRSSPPVVQPGVDPQQFLLFLHNLSRLTSEVSVDVSKYQTQLNTLTQKVGSDPQNASKEEVQKLLKQIMDANNSLQNRLDQAEERLESQTKEIASYLTEARTDGLTGLANRRAFDQFLDEQSKKFAVTKKPFTLVLIDIDHFKKINDTYGHPAGDAVLKEVASRLKQNSSGAVLVARYGGEEFALLFESPLMKGAESTEQLRAFIAAYPVDAEGKKIHVTISCGVAESLPEERIGKLVRRSDEALYSAKLGGRNRVYIHDGKLCSLVGNPPPAAVTAAKVPQEPGIEDLEVSDEVRDRIQQRLQKIIAEESRRNA